MKKTIWAYMKVLPLIVSSLFLLSCTNDIDNASTTAGIDSSGDDAVALSDNDGKSDKNTRKESASGGSSSDPSYDIIDFADNFIRGFDASAVDYYENVYAPSNTWTKTPWFEKDGTEKTFFNMLADHGFNTIRLRVWVDPTVTSTINNDSYWPTSTTNWRIGDTTLERTTSFAKKAKTAGFKVLIDFHLSDYWTDPSVQLIPESWQTITSASEMAEKLSSYMTEALEYMKNNGVTPDFVQVGNEIDRGILVDKSVDASQTPKSATTADAAISGGISTNNFKTYIKAACKAVRDFDSGIKIIIHITTKNESRFLNIPSDTEYDIVGLSYYPWEDHGTISNLKTVIQKYVNAGKTVMVVETSASAKSYTDDYASRAYTNLGGESIYDDVATDDSKVTATEVNQKNILRHIMQEVFDAGGNGICIWGGERRDDQYGLCDWGGNVYEAIDAFNYKPADGYPSESEGENVGNSDDSSDDAEEETGESLPYTASSFPFEKAYVGTGSSETFLKKDSFVNVSAATATIKFSWSTWSGNPWFGAGSTWVSNDNGLQWGTNEAYGTISVETLKQNDLQVGGAENGEYTITVSISE